MDATRAAAAKRGGPVPALTVFRLDPRFPLEVGFDSNLRELGASIEEMRSTMSACSVVVEFGGIIGGVMRSAVAAAALVAGDRSSLAAHATPIEGLGWLQPRVDLARTDDYLNAVQRMKVVLDVR